MQTKNSQPNTVTPLQIVIEPQISVYTIVELGNVLGKDKHSADPRKDHTDDSNTKDANKNDLYE